MLKMRLKLWRVRFQRSCAAASDGLSRAEKTVAPALRATFSWDPVSSLFPEALALLQQSVVKSGGGMSVWELAALNLVMPLRKQSLGMRSLCISHPCLHWTGKGKTIPR
ncbi:hypothetical protein RLOC_00001145 [Lonchura striata]|uniref:Uncharacterized protein n=1 Tax=Lonchura striata TaxID=40157 RepID=A0A218V6W4_9PASE|nr:hypothetical protein RLOC_00001145 [Lonchura striata domestica]